MTPWPGSGSAEIQGPPADLASPAGATERAAPPEAPTCAIRTLGCKVNQYDSFRIARQLRARGFRLVPFSESADVYLIDTCTVTHVADQKSRKALRRAVRKNPQALVAVTGCAAEWAPEQFAGIGAHTIVLGNRHKDELAERIVEALRQRSAFDFAACKKQPLDGPYVTPLGDRTRAVLKVMDGCDRVCAFCIIPRVRGKPRSRPFEEVLQEARQMAGVGAREIVLTGVILGWYGSDLPARNNRGAGASRSRLPELLRALQEVEGLRRIRLSAVDPRDAGDELFEAMAECGKLTPYLHLVLQSGCDATLRAMRRGYTRGQFAERVRRLRAAIPHVGLYTDVLVGFPGESEAHFRETLDFVRAMRFSGMHIFPFSKRPGTEAARLPDPLAPETIARRGRELGGVARRLRSTFAESQLQRPVTMLAERRLPDGCWEGLTGTYLRVHGAGGPGLRRGDLATVRVERWNGDGEHLEGEIV